MRKRVLVVPWSMEPMNVSPEDFVVLIVSALPNNLDRVRKASFDWGDGVEAKTWSIL